MVMAFLLIVVIDGLPEPTDGMYFRDITRCNYFSREIERGRRGLSRIYVGQQNITAYCTPRMVPEGTQFWD